MNRHDHNQLAPRGGERRYRPEWPGADVGGLPSFLGGRGGRGGPGGRRGGLGGPGGPAGPDGPDADSAWGGRRGRGRGPRARGDVRAAILLLLDEQPRHGYELIQEIAERSSGAWTPSPGSVYPTLQALEDEGLATIERLHGRRTASLTPDGTAYVEANREQLGTPWESVGGDHGPAFALREEYLALKDAVRQVARVGAPAQHTAAAAALAAARKELYRLLADDAAPPS